MVKVPDLEMKEKENVGREKRALPSLFFTIGKIQIWGKRAAVQFPEAKYGQEDAFYFGVDECFMVEEKHFLFDR